MVPSFKVKCPRKECQLVTDSNGLMHVHCSGPRCQEYIGVIKADKDGNYQVHKP